MILDRTMVFIKFEGIHMPFGVAVFICLMLIAFSVKVFVDYIDDV